MNDQQMSRLDELRGRIRKSLVDDGIFTEEDERMSPDALLRKVEAEESREPPLTVCQVAMTAIGMLCLAAWFAIAYCVLTQFGETP